MRPVYPSIPERMYLSGLSEGVAKVRVKRIAACVTGKTAPYKWMRMRLSAERDGSNTPLPIINNPTEAVRFIVQVYPEILDANAEHVVVLALDIQSRPTAVFPLSIGGRNNALVDMKNVFLPAILAPGTSRIVLAHNHPSGNPKLSSEDREVFARAKEAASLLGFIADDFLAITEREVASVATGSVEVWAQP